MIIKKNVGSAEAIENVRAVKEHEHVMSFKEYDNVIFGEYPQQDISGKIKEPIEWIVVSKHKSEHEVLLLSKYILDTKMYYGKVDGEKELEISLEKWLNNEFYNAAFSKDEKNRIVIKNEWKFNGAWSEKEYDENIKVFCLSKDNLNSYFKCASSRWCGLSTNATKYALNVKVNNESLQLYDNGTSPFFIEDVSSFGGHPFYVNNNNYIVEREDYALKHCCGVRPAIWVRY